MTNKLIARWTLGPCSKFGMACVKKSIQEFSKIYPEFDRVICYNNIEKPIVFSNLNFLFLFFLLPNLINFFQRYLLQMMLPGK